MEKIKIKTHSGIKSASVIEQFDHNNRTLCVVKAYKSTGFSLTDKKSGYRIGPIEPTINLAKSNGIKLLNKHKDYDYSYLPTLNE